MEPIQTTQGKAGHPHTPSNCKRFHPTPSPPVTEGPGSEAPRSSLRPSQPRSQQPVCASLQSDRQHEALTVLSALRTGRRADTRRRRTGVVAPTGGNPAPRTFVSRVSGAARDSDALGRRELSQRCVRQPAPSPDPTVAGAQLKPVGLQRRPPGAAKLPNFANRKARLLALRQGRARLRQCDATQFWREKRCIWIPAVAGRGRPGEKGGGWGRQGVCRGVRGPH